MNRLARSLLAALPLGAAVSAVLFALHVVVNAYFQGPFGIGCRNSVACRLDTALDPGFVAMVVFALFLLLRKRAHAWAWGLLAGLAAFVVGALLASSAQDGTPTTLAFILIFGALTCVPTVLPVATLSGVVMGKLAWLGDGDDPATAPPRPDAVQVAGAMLALWSVCWGMRNLVRSFWLDPERMLAAAPHKPMWLLFPLLALAIGIGLWSRQRWAAWLALAACLYNGFFAVSSLTRHPQALYAVPVVFYVLLLAVLALPKPRALLAGR